MITLGSRLREARERKGWSQKHVSQITGISNANISNYERDFRKPDYESIVKLASLYDESIDYLITGHTREELEANQKEAEQKRSIRGHFTTNDNRLNRQELVMVPVYDKFYPKVQNGYIPVVANELDLQTFDYFWYRVPDAAMIGDDIPPDGLVLIRTEEDETNQYQNGSIRLVVDNGKHTLRRVFEYEDEKLIAVQSSNPDYPLRLIKHRFSEWMSYGIGEVIRVMRNVNTSNTKSASDEG